MLHTVQILRGRTDDGVPALFYCCRMNLGQSPASQLPGIGKLVNLRTQNIHTVETPNAAFVGKAAQETPGGPPLLASPGPELPGDDPMDPAVQAPGVKRLGYGSYGIQLHLTGGL